MQAAHHSSWHNAFGAPGIGSPSPQTASSSVDVIGTRFLDSAPSLPSFSFPLHWPDRSLHDHQNWRKQQVCLHQGNSCHLSLSRETRFLGMVLDWTLCLFCLEPLGQKP